MTNLNRTDILKQAVHECYKEMFAKAQPSVDYDQLIKDHEEGKIDESETKIYERYYLSPEEHQYIINKYLNAYRINSEWRDDVKVVEEYLETGGYREVIEPDKYDEEAGFNIPGSKHYEKDKSLLELFKEYFYDKLGTSENDIANELYAIVMEKINKCKNYYRFNSEESNFIFTMALGHAPTSNKETVIKYWKSKGKDIQIEDRNPLLLWSMDEYGDDFEEIMNDEYGENWKEYWDEEYRKNRSTNEDM